jgi:acetyltransferase-like isoleucine patch superfamily enzyme
MLTKEMYESMAKDPDFIKAVQDVMINQKVVCGDASRLHVAPTASVNNALFNLMGGDVWIEDWVFFGHGVSVLTGKHFYNFTDEERQKAVDYHNQTVIIRRGAWIASNVTIIGPCEIGQNSVVAAGAVVTSDVPPNCMVGGVPAKLIKAL